MHALKDHAFVFMHKLENFNFYPKLLIFYTMSCADNNTCTNIWSVLGIQISLFSQVSLKTVYSI